MPRLLRPGSALSLGLLGRWAAVWMPMAAAVLQAQSTRRVLHRVRSALVLKMTLQVQQQVLKQVQRQVQGDQLPRRAPSSGPPSEAISPTQPKPARRPSPARPGAASWPVVQMGSLSKLGVWLWAMPGWMLREWQPFRQGQQVQRALQPQQAQRALQKQQALQALSASIKA